MTFQIELLLVENLWVLDSIKEMDLLKFMTELNI